MMMMMKMICTSFSFNWHPIRLQAHPHGAGTPLRVQTHPCRHTPQGAHNLRVQAHPSGCR